MDTYANRFNTAVAAELRAERAALNMTIQEVVDKSGLVKQTVLRYLSDQRPIPVPALAAICQALGVQPGQILDRATDRARIEE